MGKFFNCLDHISIYVNVHFSDICAVHPCKNGGTCSYNADNGFVCTCPDYCSGRYCESCILGEITKHNICPLQLRFTPMQLIFDILVIIYFSTIPNQRQVSYNNVL